MVTSPAGSRGSCVISPWNSVRSRASIGEGQKPRGGTGDAHKSHKKTPRRALVVQGSNLPRAPLTARKRTLSISLDLSSVSLFRRKRSLSLCVSDDASADGSHARVLRTHTDAPHITARQHYSGDARFSQITATPANSPASVDALLGGLIDGCVEVVEVNTSAAAAAAEDAATTVSAVAKRGKEEARMVQYSLPNFHSQSPRSLVLRPSPVREAKAKDGGATAAAEGKGRSGIGHLFERRVPRRYDEAGSKDYIANKLSHNRGRNSAKKANGHGARRKNKGRRASAMPEKREPSLLRQQLRGKCLRSRGMSNEFLHAAKVAIFGEASVGSVGSRGSGRTSTSSRSCGNTSVDGGGRRRSSGGSGSSGSGSDRRRACSDPDDCEDSSSSVHTINGWSTCFNCGVAYVRSFRATPESESPSSFSSSAPYSCSSGGPTISSALVHSAGFCRGECFYSHALALSERRRREDAERAAMERAAAAEERAARARAARERAEAELRLQEAALAAATAEFTNARPAAAQAQAAVADGPGFSGYSHSDSRYSSVEYESRAEQQRRQHRRRRVSQAKLRRCHESDTL